MKRIFTLILFAFPSFGFAQFGVSFHQSNIPFLGVNYEINEKFRAEVRIGTDNYFDDTTLEAIITYDILTQDDYELYAGVGGRINTFPGIVVPIGLNIYPFTLKKFGFQMELTPIMGDSFVLRGSWGIRYRFLNEQ